ncbi:MAG: hypothetical protein FWF56_00135 [Firmicutes bacterium]|nr:hypothetical protein [Bacillota bacterium]MCL1954299.1 hypothetical protein [Bacillota bacterium]
MVKTLKGVSFVLTMLLLAAFFVACNPSDPNEDENPNSIHGATITASTGSNDGTAQNINVTVVQGTELTLTAGVPENGNDGWTLVRRWTKDETNIDSETNATYKVDTSTFGKFKISVHSKFVSGEKSTDELTATANISIVDKNAPQNVNLVFNNQKGDNIWVPANVADNAKIQLEFDKIEDSKYEIQWLLNDSVVSGNTSQEYTIDTSTFAEGKVVAQVRTVATDNEPASNWASATARVSVFGVQFDPISPDVWYKAPQRISAHLLPQTQVEVEWNWKLVGVNGGEVHAGIGLDVDKTTGEAIISVSDTNTPPAEYKFGIQASTVVNKEGIEHTVVSQQTLRVYPDDPTLPDSPKPASSVKMQWVDGGVIEENQNVIPSETIEIKAYVNQEFTLKAIHSQLPNGVYVEYRTGIYGNASYIWVENPDSTWFYEETTPTDDGLNFRTFRIDVRTYIIADNGIKVYQQKDELGRDHVSVVAKVYVVKMKDLDSPTGVVVDTVGLQQQDEYGRYVVVYGQEYTWEAKVDRLSGVSYYFDWWYSGSGPAGIDENIYNFTIKKPTNGVDTDWGAERFVRLSVTARLYNSHGDLIAQSKPTEVNISFIVMEK